APAAGQCRYAHPPPTTATRGSQGRTPAAGVAAEPRRRLRRSRGSTGQRCRQGRGGSWLRSCHKGFAYRAPNLGHRLRHPLTIDAARLIAAERALQDIPLGLECFAEVLAHDSIKLRWIVQLLALSVGHGVTFRVSFGKS